MKIPATPPKYMSIIQEIIGSDPEAFTKIMATTVDYKGRYLHWDKLRYLDTGTLKNEYYWAGMKMARSKISEVLPFTDKCGEKFSFCTPNLIQKELHLLDRDTAGTIQSASEHINPSTKNTYLIRSLVEEAISSSQLEGASTTRHVAKDMIRKERDPRDNSEQMILNNYHAMQFIKENKNENLTIEMICELHRILTNKTLDDNKIGIFRDNTDIVNVVDEDSQVLHSPPVAEELNDKMNLLCQFANDEIDNDFIHPIIKAIILHFMLAYNHPFVDGNGRTARALFYWSIAKHGYWLMEFISISTVIKKAPIKYGKAFLYTETDANDLTHFIIQQLKVVKEGVNDLIDYLNVKRDRIANAEEILKKSKKLNGKLNFRQHAILRHALKHPRYLYRIYEHQNTHGIVYETARKDLLFMAENLGLLTKLKEGKSIVFMSPEDLESIIEYS